MRLAMPREAEAAGPVALVEDAGPIAVGLEDTDALVPPLLLGPFGADLPLVWAAAALAATPFPSNSHLIAASPLYLQARNAATMSDSTYASPTASATS